MAGCYGNSSYDRYLESKANAYWDEDDRREFYIIERTYSLNGGVSESNYTSYAEDITDAFNLTYQNRPVLKNGKRSKAKLSHFYPRDGVMLVKVGKFVTAVVKEIEY